MSDTEEELRLEIAELTGARDSLMEERDQAHDEVKQLEKQLGETSADFNDSCLKLRTERDAARSQLVTVVEAAHCNNCGEPATCVGRHDNQERDVFSCDTCCGHGCEDGHCTTLDAIPEPASTGKFLDEAKKVHDEVQTWPAWKRAGFEPQTEHLAPTEALRALKEEALAKPTHRHQEGGVMNWRWHVVHNALAHPLLILPDAWGFARRFHDYTASKAYGSGASVPTTTKEGT